MEEGRVILDQERFRLTLERLAQQLIESYGDFENACIIGIQRRGVFLANRLHKRLEEIVRPNTVSYGVLDITFYRDDFRTRSKPLLAQITDIDFLVEDKKVILIDDVLYTGRTIQAAMTAVQHYGRPKMIELVSLVDRRFNRHLPIKSDYVGITVDAVNEAYVKVEWAELDGEDRILLFPRKPD